MDNREWVIRFVFMGGSSILHRTTLEQSEEVVAQWKAILSIDPTERAVPCCWSFGPSDDKPVAVMDGRYIIAVERYPYEPPPAEEQIALQRETLELVRKQTGEEEDWR